MAIDGDRMVLERADQTFVWLLRRNEDAWADDAALMHRASKAKLHKRNITKLTDIKSVNSLKLLYMLGLYTQTSSRKIMKEVAVRFLNFQVLLFEAIKAGLLTYDYAPTSVDVCDGTGTRRLYVNISQEATSDILWFIEAELARRVSISSQYNRSVVALQLTPKGSMMCKTIDIGIQSMLRAFVFRGNSLLQVKFDDQANDGDGGFYCFVAESSQMNASEVTEIHNISYVASPFIPMAQLHPLNKKPFLDNSGRASESLKGKAVEGSNKNRHESITIVLPKLLLIEWIPIGINSILQLSSQLGVLERCQGGMFSAGDGKQPSSISGNSFEATPGLTSIRVLDFEYGKFINFEADIRYPESSGVVQVEFFGINMNASGCVTYGMRIEAIGVFIGDKVQLEGISRVFVDMNQDAARVCGDLLSDLQRSLVGTMHGCSVESRKKFQLILCEQLVPTHSSDVSQYINDPVLANELRQVIGDPQFALTCILEMDAEGFVTNVIVETHVSQSEDRASTSSPSPAASPSGSRLTKFSSAAAAIAAFQSPIGALALGRGMSIPKKSGNANFRYQESTTKGIVVIIVGADGAMAAGKQSGKLEPVLLELSRCHALVLAANALSDRVSAAAAKVIVLRSLVHSKLNRDPNNPSNAKRMKQELESECAMLATLSKLLLQESQTPGKPVSPEWEGLFDAMRIKVTRENAEFLAAGLVKKLFQLQQSMRHFSMFISHVGKLRSVEAAANINRHASNLASDGLISRDVRSQTFCRIASLTICIIVLRGMDITGFSLGAASSFFSAPVLWLIVSLSAAGVALFIKRRLETRMQHSKGEFVLKHDVNIWVRLGALRLWLRKQQPLQESRRGTRVCEQVRVTQASALRDSACSLTCVYDAAAERILRIDIRGISNAKCKENADYGKGLMTNLMELLQNAGVVAEEEQTEEKRVAGTHAEERKNNDDERERFDSAEQKDEDVDPHNEAASSKDTV